MSRMLWRQREDIGPPRHTHARMAYDETNRVVTLVQLERTSQTWLWDGHLWVQVADIGPHIPDALVWDAARNVLVASDSDTLWEWSGADWTQVSDQGTGQGTMVFDPRGQRLLRVTWKAEAPCLTWEWKDAAWTQIDDMGPPTRRNFALVPDHERGVVLLVGGTLLVAAPGGGYLDQPIGDTWVWDGAWKALTDMGPSPRTGMAVAYDPIRARVVLFGGARTLTQLDTYVNDTFEWDGALWRHVQDMGPSRRGAAAMAYDVGRKRIVLFGGFGPQDKRFNDTWEYFES